MVESFKVIDIGPIDIGPIGYSPITNTWSINITLEKGGQTKVFLTSELATKFLENLKETMVLHKENGDV